MVHNSRLGAETSVEGLSDTQLKNMISTLRSGRATRRAAIYENELRRREAERATQRRLEEITKTLRDLCERVAKLETTL
jgi:hypothetical protein